MDTTSTRAMLVEPRDLDAEFDAITATIPRSEVEAALSSEDPAELYLDVQRRSGEDTEERTLSVAWERQDLERLLDRAESDAITFSFARSELERAFDDDVEAHGLRERVMILTVAAAAAAGAASVSATSAAAGVDSGTGSTATPIVQVTHDEAQTANQLAAPANDEASLVARGIQAGAAHDEASLASRGIEAPQVAATHDEALTASQVVQTPANDEASLVARGIQAGAAHDEASLASRGIEAPQIAATHDEALTASQVATTPANDEASLVSRGIQATPTHDEATLVSRGIPSPPSVHDEATLVSRGIEAPPVATHDEATLVSRGIQPTPVDDGSGFEMPTVDATTGAVAAGLAGFALLITAAGFSARRGRGGPRPA
jgi:hypothetical protein